ILYNLSSDMFTHLQSLSLSFYDRTQIGRVMSRLQSDIDVLESMLSSGLLSMLGSLVSLIGIIVAMLLMNVTLALLSFTVLPIMFLIAAFWQRHAQRSFRRTRAAISVVNATLQENISGMRVIQSLAREDRNCAEFDEINRHNRDTNLQASRIAALVLPLVEVVAAVAIGYNPQRPVLHGLTLRIEAGQTIAIVGPSGAGKSTIAALLSRFYDVQGGAVLIDGHDVRAVTQRSLRSQVGVVLQDPFLFT